MDSPINKVFVQVLKAFLKDHLKVGDRTIDRIDKCTSYKQLYELWGAFGDDEILEQKIEELKEEVSNLESQVDDLEEEGTNTDPEDVQFEGMVNQMKYECFLANHEKFKLDEFQDLMGA